MDFGPYQHKLFSLCAIVHTYQYVVFQRGLVVSYLNKTPANELKSNSAGSVIVVDKDPATITTLSADAQLSCM